MTKKVAFVSEAKCDHSPFCPARRSCPAKAMAQTRSGFLRASAPQVDPERCTGCGTCVRFCPHGAITLKPKR